MRLFDQKFGADRVRELPRAPGVYLFRDAEDRVLYAGKAKDLRRRLAGYRTASRRKAHRKMRTLVREAASLEVRPQESETQALLLENELIRTLRPTYNIDGAYAFLYPALGVGQHEGRVLLAFTSTPEAWSRLDLRWHGCFRSRVRARAAFDALVALFARLGHLEPMSRLPDAKLRRGARLEALRRVPPELPAAADAFLSGDSTELLAPALRAPARERKCAARGGRGRGGAADPRRLRPGGRRPPAPRPRGAGTLRLRTWGGARRALHRGSAPLSPATR